MLKGPFFIVLIQTLKDPLLTRAFYVVRFPVFIPELGKLQHEQQLSLSIAHPLTLPFPNGITIAFQNIFLGGKFSMKNERDLV